MSKNKLGIFGLGCVGQGFYETLHANDTARVEIEKVVVKNQKKERLILNDKISFSQEDVLNDQQIGIVLELIDDAEEALKIVLKAFEENKHVVSANKKMIATNLEKLVEVKKNQNIRFLYEASVCGSIPIIRTLENYFAYENINKLTGIFNGTTNYILTKLSEGGVTYHGALLEAQSKGFAESDPTNDVEGFDTLYKTIIIVFHAYGIIIKPQNILRFGISTIKIEDIDFAKNLGKRVKLVGYTEVKEGKLLVSVLPALVDMKSALYNVNDEFNAVQVEFSKAGRQLFLGRGAGKEPTGSAVYADTEAINSGLDYQNVKFNKGFHLAHTNEIALTFYISSKTINVEEEFSFSNIKDKGKGQSFNYVIGDISLKSLLAIKDEVRKEIFIASLEEV